MRLGENFTLTRDNMPKLKEQLEQKSEMNDFESSRVTFEMTVTPKAAIELTESRGDIFNSGSPS